MIFIDTAAFIAKFIERDQHHKAALEQWGRLKVDSRKLFTSSFVIDETLTLLARRTSHAFAAARAESLFRSSVLHILRPEEVDEVEAIEYFTKYADQKVSFTDCVSFALMRKLQMRTAFSFDRHFLLAGFELEP